MSMWNSRPSTLASRDKAASDGSHSTRAELLRRAGRDGEAHHAYRRALDLAQTEPEQRFLADRLAETTPSVPSRPGCAST